MSEEGCWKYLRQEDLLHWLQFRPPAQLQNEENTYKLQIAYKFAIQAKSLVIAAHAFGRRVN